MTKVIKREALFIPIKVLTPKLKNKLKKDLTFDFFKKEKICNQCEWVAERVNDVCESCANYNGSYELANQVIINDKKYLKVPVGSAKKTLATLERNHVEVRLVDKSPKEKIKPVKFLGTFRDGQAEAVEAMLKKKRGVLRAPPRSGKTVMGTALVCKLRQKTLILGSQRDWLMGFKETFIGSETQEPLTTLSPKRIKLCKTLEDFEAHDVCLATVQTFYSPGGEKLLRKIRDMFPVILIDEVHTAAADKYAQIVSKLNADYAIGFSGTPQRKDQKEVLVENIVGPIIHTMVTTRLRPRVFLTRTGYSKKEKGPGRRPWPAIVSSLENDKKRIKVIAKQALKDIKDGHMILIPVAQVKPIKKIVDKINDLAGKKVAYSFTGGLKKDKRDLYIQKARDYKIRCLVGTQKILSVGINIPRASMLYEVVLSSNLPNAEQRMARVLTPMEGKPQPGIRLFLDDMSVRKNCMRNEFYRVLKPIFKPIMSENDMTLLEAYFKGGEVRRGFDL